jgi:alcohol dehydrogenase (cytochrome c)
MELPRHSGYFWVLILLMGQWPSVSLAQDADEQEAAFSKDQAYAGRESYREHCASCHGAKLEGHQLAPSLVGRRFDQAWRGKPAYILSFHLRRMPPEPVAEGGSLSDEIYTNILAYLLKSNGMDSGDVELPSSIEALAEVTIPRLEGAEYDPDAPVAPTEEQAKLLANLPLVTDEMLLDPSPNNWLHWGRTHDGQSFSPLDQINRETVSSLKPAWRASLRGGRNMPTPLVHHGVMFLHTYPDTVLAMDASNGMVLWRYQRKGLPWSSKKMGLGLHGDKVFVPTSDLHVIALNAKTGELIWEHAIATEAPEKLRRSYQSYELRSAPFVVGDKVIQGITASGSPKGAFILAVNIDSGEEVWRFNTIARPGEPQGNTWNGLALEKRSGGSVWHQGTYDAELNLIYYGVAPTYDTGPLLYPSEEEGVTNQAMYTNCTVALNADTGELVWFYQHMQNDQWDLDWAFERQIADVKVDGVTRRAVMNVGKMSILDALDAATGEFLFAVDPGVQNVITAIDPETGAKTIDPGKMPAEDRPCVVCPSAFGARSWPPTSYSPRTKLAYMHIAEWCMGVSEITDKRQMLSTNVRLSSVPHPDVDDGMMGRVLAIDLENQKLEWTFDQATPPSTGLLATAGGLLFSGDIDPSLKAFNDATGELLWQAPLDDMPSSTLVSYSIDGKQYIAVVVGLVNNYVRDIASAYRQFSSTKGRPGEKGGASVWVFALEDFSSYDLDTDR